MEDANGLRTLFREAAISEIDAMAESIGDSVESPIEEIMVWALICHGGSTENVLRSQGLPTAGLPGGDGEGAFCVILQEDEHERMRLWLQPWVVASGRRYRLDIGLEMAEGSASAFVAIECDGHDFHEKTKAQAKKDKLRDRDLQTIGWAVARFTGSEIVSEPREAVRSACRLAHSILRARHQEWIDSHPTAGRPA